MMQHRAQHLDSMLTLYLLWEALLGVRPSWPLSGRARRPRSQGKPPVRLAAQVLGLAVALLVACIGVAMAADTLTITARQGVVRAGPNGKRRILATLPQGTTLALLDTRQGWYRVLLDDGREGWVAQSAAQVQTERGFTVVPAVAAAAAGRMALVIGNAAYSEDIGALKNPGNDATDMAATLRQLGFAVTLVRDANHQRMDEAVEDFSRQLRPGSVGVFYYAGHGAQVGGRNYLIPVGARISTEAVVPYQGVAAEEVLARMDAAGQGKPLNVMILDACRNAPFMRGWRSPLRGLAPMQATGGSLIAYATAPGSVAKDGTGRNGTYTQHLLRFMTEPNLPVEVMFRQVRVAVEQETNGQQIPWELSSLRENFVFNPGAGGTVSTPAVSTPTASTPAVVTPPPAPPSGPSGGTQVAVGVYPPTSATPPATITGNDGAPMVLVPAGEFIIGSNEYEDEKPPHRVHLDGFYIDTYEVTNARFQQFVQASNYRTRAERDGSGWADTGEKWESVNGASWRAPQGSGSSITGLEQHPVVQVSQEDARAYCAWAGKRLPTEAEWEKAARGPDGRRYPWGENFDGTRLNFCDVNCRRSWQDKAVNDGYRYTAPVGRYEGGKSPYGAYDMAGNVWEWVADFYDKEYYKNSPTRNPQGPVSGAQVVVRGGGWNNYAPNVRAPSRGGNAPATRSAASGSGVPRLCNSFLLAPWPLGRFLLVFS